jgi:hypothetical protein
MPSKKKPKVAKKSKVPVKKFKNTSKAKKRGNKGKVKKARISFEDFAKSKYFFALAPLVFAIGLLAFSFYSFGVNKKAASSVQGVNTVKTFYAPNESTIVSTNQEEESGQVTTYTTTLSKDQIQNFYSQLAVLNGWNKITNLKYTCLEGGQITIDIEQEKDNKNLVTYTHCK